MAAGTMPVATAGGVMTHRTVGEVMTADVASVRLTTPFKELAATMARRGVSGLPVLDDGGRVAGVVSEADLLVKEETQDDPHARRLPWWRRWAQRSKAAGERATDVMSSPAVTIGPGATVVEAARAIDRHHVKRLVVVDGDGRLLGIVSRRDLLRVFLRSDEQVAGEVRDQVFGAALGTNPALVRVEVTEGVVTLSGEVERRSMLGPAVAMAHSVDGVVDVVDRLTFAIDDVPPPVTGPPGVTDPMNAMDPYFGPSGESTRSA